MFYSDVDILKKLWERIDCPLSAFPIYYHGVTLKKHLK